MLGWNESLLSQWPVTDKTEHLGHVLGLACGQVCGEVLLHPPLCTLL